MAKSIELQEIEVWDGNTASSNALRQAQIDVIAAYPITPSTPIVQNYGSFKDNGYIDGDFALVESEHAAMSACVGAAAAGGRVSTATSSQGSGVNGRGFITKVSGMRSAIVGNLVNRALAAPLNIHGDHSDMYLSRDSGWISLCTCNPQEAYDFTLMAFKLGEHQKVRVPTIVNQDGFLCSHTVQNVRPLSDGVAYQFVGEYQTKHSLVDFDKPVSYGAQAEEEWHYEHKARLHHAIMSASSVIEEVFNDFAKLTGRQYHLTKTFQLEDAEIAIFALGTTYESAIVAAKEMRKKGIKAGVATIHSCAPSLMRRLGRDLKNLKALAILDKRSPAGAMGAMFNEVTSTVYQTQGTKHPVVSNYIYGLGERDMTIAHLCEIFEEINEDALKGTLTHPTQQFVGLRGPKMSFF
uniref:PorA subunit of pyruvate:flavodoxin oxidoreductase n=1 Tax=Helicobacter pylori TaxID=210 RepID=O68223_HELPX|nr:PorA subunit of pyruvate:flavodoxin oxidoreductase [Helicobacter pylori NCTC 11637 = CCUG 17874 = ATCC 43504 = JCM 12093]